MNGRRKNWNGIAAFAAAFMLVLQSVSGAMAGPPAQRDIFGNMLCVGGMAQPGPTERHGDGHLPICCILGCSPVATGLPADEVHLAAPLAELSTGGRTPPREIVAADRRTPANPRAPPPVA